MNDQIFELEIKDLSDANKTLTVLENKKIPVIGICNCIDTNNECLLKIACEDKHLILISKRYSEVVLELTRAIEEEIPILY